MCIVKAGHLSGLLFLFWFEAEEHEIGGERQLF